MEHQNSKPAVSLDSFLNSLIAQGKKKLSDQKRTKGLAPLDGPAPVQPYAKPTWHISHLLVLHVNKICNHCGDVRTDASLFLMEIGPGAALRSTRDIPYGLENKDIPFQHEYRDEHIAFCSTCAMTQEPRLLLQSFVAANTKPAAAQMPPQDLVTGQEFK